MHSIKRRLALILTACSIAAVLLSALLVNTAVSATFNKYMKDNQDKRDARIIEYFQEVYKTGQGWNENSGLELSHEALMNNYCLTLKDANGKVVWGMNPGDISHQSMVSDSSGIYSEKTYEIKDNSAAVGFITIGQYSPVILSEADINFRNSINLSIALGGLIAIAAGVVISIFASRQFSGPIKDVSEASVKLAGGNYDSVIEGKSGILEINSLISSMNVLGRKLSAQDTLRKRLVTDVSHEIRTPLNVLQNNLEAMIDGVIPVDAARLESLNEEVVRFGKLLNNLDTLKGVESENARLSMRKVQLDAIISDVCKDFEIEMKDKNIKLDIITQKHTDYSIKGDRDLLRQVFINLLSNAVKFSGDGGSITIEEKADAKNVYVEIADTGIGIRKDDVPFIFERMYRGDKSRNEIEGSGVGLSIVKNVMLLHNADIELNSEAGEGTSFKLRFGRE